MSAGAPYAARGTLPALVAHAARMQLRATLVWGVVLGLYSALIVASFPAVEDQSRAIEQLARSYPEAVREAFSLDALTTIEGYLDSQVFSLAPLALAFFPVLSLSAAIAGAEERGTLDVLLSNPVPRWQLVAGSFLAAALSLLGVVALLGLLTWGTAALFGVDLGAGRAAEASLNLWPICLFFGGLALLCSALFHRRALAVAVPGVLLFGMYLLDVVGRVVDGLEDFRRLSAFYYYGSAIRDGVGWSGFVGLALCAALLAVLAALAFRRRDIYA
ncbi:ABC-2 type transporter [Rubrobacter xylanophilus DSM 9941]|uniref:ABC-2 type transporter n=1 Tax=Rubrobacter xylanophilus (strain DSM 9941 / JCM 11954 / NBRC 16129 / PRD-1) TaxID=266117 RepID=Q1AZV8_RUBXD|nr:ABC transporter permease subunit [Rubrobacter xylanophilus]ABG03070.1 ABC-2 type transporter [Rubrobacter xylanophilus DSM 9941]